MPDTFNILICYDVDVSGHLLQKELSFLKDNFLGLVSCVERDAHLSHVLVPTSRVFLCGNVKGFLQKDDLSLSTVKYIKELSRNYDDAAMEEVPLGQVPINIHDVGVYFRRYLDARALGGLEEGFFAKVLSTHQFQSLSEGNKSGTSFRKGIYLSNVEQAGDAKVFHLLRCSTNLDGPTEGFSDVDRHIVTSANEACRSAFPNAPRARLNHVLAQVYENGAVNRAKGAAPHKDRKARIAAHSDKTKDMPSDGVIAFCTFYASEQLATRGTPAENDLFDHVYRSTSVLTQLRFRLKDCVLDKSGLLEDFTVKLYDNSIFVIPLSTNRLYTHETVPSTLPSDRIPTRIGYVIRCSKTQAMYRDGGTYIRVGTDEDDARYVEMRKPTDVDYAELKAQYLKENMTDSAIEYGDVLYSMNSGDYLEPSL
ncbi:hypothetical protein HKX48_007782 [Thoreauomyces humboldtii]|nr:hypothetical protein HKX48_007782 [Thoreauomyces humboldtii]